MRVGFDSRVVVSMVGAGLAPALGESGAGKPLPYESSREVGSGLAPALGESGAGKPLPYETDAV